MTDRRESTVEEIRQHLAYRAANAQVLMTVHPTRVFGHYTKVYVDEAQHKFFVTNRSNWQVENPDVIDVAQVIDCRVDVKEDRDELYHNDREGNRVPICAGGVCGSEAGSSVPAPFSSSKGISTTVHSSARVDFSIPAKRRSGALSYSSSEMGAPEASVQVMVPTP